MADKWEHGSADGLVVDWVVQKVACLVVRTVAWKVYSSGKMKAY